MCAPILKCPNIPHVKNTWIGINIMAPWPRLAKLKYPASSRYILLYSPMKIHDKLTSQNAGAEGEGEQGLVLKAKASEILHGYIPELENLNTPRVGGKSHCFRSIFL